MVSFRVSRSVDGSGRECDSRLWLEGAPPFSLYTKAIHSLPFVINYPYVSLTPLFIPSIPFLIVMTAFVRPVRERRRREKKRARKREATTN